MTSLLDRTKIKYVPTAHTYPLVIKKNQTMVDNNLSKKKMRQWWRRRQITHKQSTELMLPIRMLRDFPDSKVRLLFLRRKRICDLETLTTRQRHQHFSLAKRTLLFFSNDEQSKVYMMVAASCFDGRDLRHRPAQVSWGEKSTPHQSAGAGQLVQGPSMRGRQMTETTTDAIRFSNQRG